MHFRYKKITVKIGSNVLAKPDGTLNVSRIAHLVDQIAFLRKNGVEVVQRFIVIGTPAAQPAQLNAAEIAGPWRPDVAGGHVAVQACAPQAL